jgi:cytochrome c553
MWTHYGKVGDMQSAVIMGDLERARQAARWVADHETLDDMPSGAEVHVTAMRDEARAGATAATLAEAATAVGRTARTCGACHTGLGVGPRFSVGSGPGEGADSVATRMMRHLWAADRLWDGLVGPSEDAWTAGATALADYPFSGADLDLASDAVVDSLAGMVQQLGTTAFGASDPYKRAEIYGALLGTCASCHMRVESID